MDWRCKFDYKIFLNWMNICICKTCKLNKAGWKAVVTKVIGSGILYLKYIIYYVYVWIYNILFFFFLKKKKKESTKDMHNIGKF